MGCPFCGNALPGDVDDGQLIVCLGCAAHLRRKGDRVEVETPPPGEAVPSPVEREDTDRAIVAASVEPARAAVDARAVSDDPEALPPLPTAPAAVAFEPNAPSAPTSADDDRTPPVGVPLPPRASVPAAVAAAPTPSSPSPTPSPSPATRSRLRTVVVVALAALAAAAVAIAALR